MIFRERLTVGCFQPITVFILEQIPLRAQEFIKRMTFQSRFPGANTTRGG